MRREVGGQAAPHRPDHPTTNAHQRSSDSSDVTVVPGTFYAESGRCTHPWIVVDCCAWCERPHRHIVADHEPTYRKAPSCAPWRRYLVHVVAVVPHSDTVRAGGVG